MTNEDGLWTKTLPLEEGTFDYHFKIEGGTASGRDTFSDWKSPRLKREEGGIYNSCLVIPDDLEGYSARLQSARQTGAGIEVPLFYQAFPGEDPAYCPGGYGRPAFAATPPVGDWKFPGFVAKEPLYCSIQFGNSTFLAVLDQTTKTDPFYSRIFFDRNGNRDLTDEEPMEASSQRNFGDNSFYYSFPPVDVQLEAKDHQQPYRFTIFASGSIPVPGNPRQPDEMRLHSLNLYVMPSCAYMGEFLLDGVGYRVAIGDATANASFGDRVELSERTGSSNRQLVPSGDSFLITRNNYFSGRNSLLLGDSLVVGDRLFDVHLDIPGGILLLQPRDNDVGTLELPSPMQSLNLFSSKGKGLMAVDAGSRIPIPSGEWSLLTYSLLKEDAWGDQWVLRAEGSEEPPAVVVPKNGSIRLEVGEPLRSLVLIPDPIRKRAVAIGSLRMSFLLRGNQDEIITDLRRISGTNTQHKLAKRDANRPEEPTYRIIKPDGELVTSGSFEYG